MRKVVVLLVLLVLIGSQMVAQLAKGEDEFIVPQYPDWMYRTRLAKLDVQTPIKLDYNESVRAYIDVYTLKRRAHLSKILSRAQLYFPLFEEYLDKYDLPLELKYLAVIESALDPRAKSSSGAMGLWQFLYHAGTMFDLEVTSFVDERCDPVKSTEAACKYLKYLYYNFKDWQLALAAYNGGIGTVKKAIERSGGISNYWDLRPHLPEQVKGYVPAFIAANYALSFYEKHAIEPADSFLSFSQVDTVLLTKTSSLKKLAFLTGVEPDVIELLNPSFKKGIVPVVEMAVPVFLPKKASEMFFKIEAELYDSLPAEKSDKVGCTEGRCKQIHCVAGGEYFHKIAIQYQCRVEDVVYWNNLKNRKLFPGQKLIVWAPEKDDRFFFVRNEVGELMPSSQLNSAFLNNGTH